MIEYRPEIDGLRAVAIVPVILFHLGAGWLPGGFLGVDVFFVISGFLITSILLREMMTGQFSFRRFWSRRIRRIAPALLVVTVATLAAAWIVVFPPDRPAIGRQAAATLLSVANIYFWRFAGDYWGPQAEDSPFLHAWSLAVEEQFYVLFPVILYAICRWFPRRILVGLLAILVGSLCLFVDGAQRSPSATFYLLPTRAWELATGAVVAAVMHGRHMRMVPGHIGAALACGGLGATVAAYFVIPTLSMWAVVPVFGTALVIWSGNGGWAKTFLSQPTLVYVGKISYSLYLWHWPVIVLSRHLGYEVHASVLVAIMTALAVMSYRLVEQPFRRRADVIRAIGYGCAGSLGIAATLAFVGSPPYDTSEFDRPQTYGRFFDIDPRSADDEQRRAFYASADAPESSAPPDAYRSDGIIVGSGTGSPAVVVLGDSHGCMWAHAIRTVVDEAGLKAAFFCMAGELPFMAIPPSRNGRSRVLTVSEKFDYDVARIHTIERWKPDVVVICARWSIVKPGEPDGLLEFLQQHVKRVVLIESPPELAGVHNHNVAQVAVFRGIHPQVGMRQYWQPGNSEVYEAGRVLVRSTAAKFPNCEIVPTKDLFTADDRVWFLDGRTLLYLDDDHLTTAGAVQVLPRLRKILAPPLTSSIEPRSRGSAPWVRHWVEATPTVIGR